MYIIYLCCNPLFSQCIVASVDQSYIHQCIIVLLKTIYSIFDIFVHFFFKGHICFILYLEMVILFGQVWCVEIYTI